MSLRAILFDFDGTLVDSEALHFQSWMRVLAPWQVSYDELAFCDEFSGVPTLKSAEILNQRHKLNTQAQLLAEQKNRLFVDVAATMLPSLMPNADEVLKLASKQYILALVTGSTREEALPVLKHYALDSLFACIVCKDDVTHPKPHPEPYCKALSLLGLKSSEAIAIEDTHTGLSSATSAGLKTIVVPNHHSKEQDFSQASYNVENLQAAWETLKQLA
ncbi:HAD family hydrolase [Pseudoalteromonas sp. JBTF-M23]|uniref:HAD family hydrolase n=1 Tax=Pseudoalteromonas caenipelagi TaxID=2726988 RepID=A0A849VG82_9GAMM|nr:HAD family phosphatase [Pseudoalteromonas caenipelagi]NOU52432.1 HAD family hydrolase [Pseudoalteromonas caenipelagi]